MTVPLYDLTDTWNDSGTVFTGLKLNVTNTASAAGSLLADFQIGGSSKFNVRKDGLVLVPQDHGRFQVNIQSAAGAGTASDPVFGSPGAPGMYFGDCLGSSNNILFSRSGNVAEWAISATFQFIGAATAIFGFASNTLETNASADVLLARDAAGIFAQRNSTNAQTFRVYNTFTDASNYERGVFDWTTTSNVLTIGTQTLGTGSARNLTLVATGTTLTWSLAGQTASWTLPGGGQTVFNTGLLLGSTQIGMVSTCNLNWSANSGVPAGITTQDTGISRSAAAVLAFGNGTQGDGSATILAKTKAGAFTASDVTAGTWALCRDTSGATTKLIYNNAGTLMTVALT